jgi:hypothetical protein
MTPVQTARRLLVDAAGEALCNSCLAFACSTSLMEMRQITEELLTSGSFQRSDRCVSCRRTAPAIAYTAKCAHCNRAVLPGEDALVAESDILHAACFRVLASDEGIRISRTLNHTSRRLVEDARRQLRTQRERPDATASGD